ncbi:fibronectin type III-like domain-contianing protein, partial [Acrocarpospora pleiomorpha]
LYLSHPGPTISRPHRWLAAYAPATADPGECTEVVLRLTARSYQHWSPVHHSWQTDPGPYVVLAGPSAGTLPLTTTITPPVG